MTPADLERVREWARLADEATPGPWESGPLGSGTVYSVVDYETRTTSGACDNDVRFIAAARMAVPELARMLGEALSERDQWRDVAGAWEERAHAAMRFADVASDELKRMRAREVKP